MLTPVSNTCVAEAPRLCVPTNPGEKPCLIEQTERLVMITGELVANVNEQYRFVGNQVYNPVEATDETITGRLHWCFDTIDGCCKALAHMREFLQ